MSHLNSDRVSSSVLRCIALMLFLCSTFAHSPLRAQSTGFIWAQRQGAAGADATTTAQTDGSGNIYFGGYYTGIVNFGGTTLSSAGARDGYIVKYSRSGQLVWAKAMNEFRSAMVNAIAFGPEGDLYVAGTTNDTVARFASPSLKYVDRMFVARFDTSGRLVWKLRTENRGFAAALGIAVARGRVFVSGASTDSLVFGTIRTGSAIVVSSAITLACDTSGVPLWVRRTTAGILSLGTDTALSAAADTNGNVYITGTYRDSINFGGAKLLNTKAAGLAFMASYDSTGRLRWAKTMSPLGSRTNGLAYASGSLYVGGELCLAARVEPNGTIDRIVSNEGNTIGVASISVSAPDPAAAPAVWTTGYTAAALRVDTVQMNVIGTHFIMKFDTALIAHWITRFTSTRPLVTSTFAADNVGNRWFAGTFTDSVRIGSQVVGSKGLTDGLVALMTERELSLEPGTLSESTPTFCAGDSIELPYVIQGEYLGHNVFSAELSDRNGSFNSPAIVASILGDSSAGSGIVHGVLHAKLPLNTQSGSKYRIRLHSSSPEIVSADNGHDLTIYAVPTLLIDPGTTFDLCEGDTITIFVTGAARYRWSNGDTANSFRVFDDVRPGQLTLTAYSPTGCATTKSFTVTKRLLPPVPAITAMDNMLYSTSQQGNQWYRNGVAIPGATLSSYLVTTSGRYSVSVTNQYKCSSMSDEVTVTLASVEDELAARPRISVQPGGIMIETAGATRATISLYDLLGHVVAEHPVALSAGANPIALQQLAPALARGVYYCTVRAGHFQESLRIVLE